jgi:uncharacterized membrane protein
MLFIGILWRKRAPKSVNQFYGYRTAMSMKNAETWDFAHKHWAKVSLKWGLATAIFSVIAILIFKDSLGVATVWILLIQCAVMFLTIIPTEKALRETFTRDGVRK